MLKRKLHRRPTLPGTILREHYLSPRDLSVTAFSHHTGISRKHLSDIVNGRVRVTPSVAVRLAHALDTTADLWANLQTAVDVYDAEEEFKRTGAGDHAASRH